MKISEIKKWAKQHGFDVIKEKDDSINGNSYYWSKIDNPQVSGVSLSVSKLATDIYNAITDYKWADHQTEYHAKKETKHIDISDYTG